MLSPAEVKPLLLHEDDSVRWLALRSFVDSYSRDPDVLPLAIRGGALSANDDDDDYRRLYNAHHLAVSDEALEMVLAHLSDQSHEADHYVYEQTLLAAPIDVLIRQFGNVQACRPIDRRLMARLRHRVKLSEKSAEGLWQELLAIADVGYDDVNESIVIHANDVVHALAEREGDFWSEVAARLQTNCERGSEWLHGRAASGNRSDGVEDEARNEPQLDQNLLLALIRLAGQGRREETAPAILGLMELDGDYLLEACQEALCRIGSLQVARIAAEKWNVLPDFVHIYLAAALGAVKQPDGEEFLLAILDKESDLGHRTSLCEQLCVNFSRRGLDVVGRQIELGYDPSIADLVDDAIAVGRVLGLELPDVDRWRQARRKWEAKSFVAALRRKFELMAKEKGIDLDDLRKSVSNSTRLPQRASTSSIADDAWESESTTIRNEGPSIGRNEPCPCGSGKKYKKCCGSRVSLRSDVL